VLSGPHFQEAKLESVVNDARLIELCRIVKAGAWLSAPSGCRVVHTGEYQSVSWCCIIFSRGMFSLCMRGRVRPGAIEDPKPGGIQFGSADVSVRYAGVQKLTLIGQEHRISEGGRAA